jgi:hypothetical protein
MGTLCLLLIMILILVLYYNNKKKEEFTSTNLIGESFTSQPESTNNNISVAPTTKKEAPATTTTLTPKELKTLIENKPNPTLSNVPLGTTVSMSQPPEKYNAKDFLPKEINNKWFDTDFSIVSKNIDDNNLINPDRYIIGINSVASSLKISSHDIRGGVPINKYVVSPWNNSSVAPDTNIKSLC